MSGPVSSAVVSDLVSRAISFLTGKFSTFMSVDERIDRLNMLRIKIKCAVEVSEKFDINIKPLQEWQEKLKKDVSEAEEALSKFQAKILHEKPNETVEGGSSSHDQSMLEEGHDGATSVLPGSNLREAVPHQVDLEPNIPHDPFMQEEGSYDATLVLPASNLSEAVTRKVNLEVKLLLATTLKHLFNRIEWLSNLLIIRRCLLVLDDCHKLGNTMDKLEKTAGDIGIFIELLKLQSKRKMCRKRKRSGRPCRSQGFFLVISLKLQTYALFFIGEDPNLLVIIAVSHELQCTYWNHR